MEIDSIDATINRRESSSGIQYYRVSAVPNSPESLLINWMKANKQGVQPLKSGAKTSTMNRECVTFSTCPFNHCSRVLLHNPVVTNKSSHTSFTKSHSKGESKKSSVRQSNASNHNGTKISRTVSLKKIRSKIDLTSKKRKVTNSWQREFNFVHGATTCDALKEYRKINMYSTYRLVRTDKKALALEIIKRNQSSTYINMKKIRENIKQVKPHEEETVLLDSKFDRDIVKTRDKRWFNRRCGVQRDPINLSVINLCDTTSKTSSVTFYPRGKNENQNERISKSCSAFNVDGQNEHVTDFVGPEHHQKNIFSEQKLSQNRVSPRSRPHLNIRTTPGERTNEKLKSDIILSPSHQNPPIKGNGDFNHQDIGTPRKINEVPLHDVFYVANKSLTHKRETYGPENNDTYLRLDSKKTTCDDYKKITMTDVNHDQEEKRTLRSTEKIQENQDNTLTQTPAKETFNKSARRKDEYHQTVDIVHERTRSDETHKPWSNTVTFENEKMKEIQNIAISTQTRLKEILNKCESRKNEFHQTDNIVPEGTMSEETHKQWSNPVIFDNEIMKENEDIITLTQTPLKEIFNKSARRKNDCNQTANIVPEESRSEETHEQKSSNLVIFENEKMKENQDIITLTQDPLKETSNKSECRENDFPQTANIISEGTRSEEMHKQWANPVICENEKMKENQDITLTQHPLKETLNKSAFRNNDFPLTANIVPGGTRSEENDKQWSNPVIFENEKMKENEAIITLTQTPLKETLSESICSKNDFNQTVNMVSEGTILEETHKELLNPIMFDNQKMEENQNIIPLIKPPLKETFNKNTCSRNEFHETANIVPKGTRPDETHKPWTNTVTSENEKMKEIQNIAILTQTKLKEILNKCESRKNEFHQTDNIVPEGTRSNETHKQWSNSVMFENENKKENQDIKALTQISLKESFNKSTCIDYEFHQSTNTIPEETTPDDTQKNWSNPEMFNLSVTDSEQYTGDDSTPLKEDIKKDIKKDELTLIRRTSTNRHTEGKQSYDITPTKLNKNVATEKNDTFSIKTQLEYMNSNIKSIPKHKYQTIPQIYFKEGLERPETYTKGGYKLPPSLVNRYSQNAVKYFDNFKKKYLDGHLSNMEEKTDTHRNREDTGRFITYANKDGDTQTQFKSVDNEVSAYVEVLKKEIKPHAHSKIATTIKRQGSAEVKNQKESERIKSVTHLSVDITNKRLKKNTNKEKNVMMESMNGNLEISEILKQEKQCFNSESTKDALKMKSSERLRDKDTNRTNNSRKVHCKLVTLPNNDGQNSTHFQIGTNNTSKHIKWDPRQEIRTILPIIDTHKITLNKKEVISTTEYLANNSTERINGQFYYDNKNASISSSAPKLQNCSTITNKYTLQYNEQTLDNFRLPRIESQRTVATNERYPHRLRNVQSYTDSKIKMVAECEDTYAVKCSSKLANIKRNENKIVRELSTSGTYLQRYSTPQINITAPTFLGAPHSKSRIINR